MTTPVAHELEATVSSGVNCPSGFIAGGVSCGTKANGNPDLALIAATRPVPCAALFTRNQLRAAPISISAEHLAASKGQARAIVINSGCANAATGEEGKRRANRVGAALAGLLRCDPRQVLMNSTGVIGEHLQDQKIVAALPDLLKRAVPTGLPHAMRAIMTTDTRPKTAAIRAEHQGRTLHVAGIAKGSGMIHPNMATMIAVLLTDAEIEPQPLDRILRHAVDRSFHRISVDGDTSTNDAVFAMASGEAGEFPAEIVQRALTDVARELALMVVRDGEGARKLIHVRVSGTAIPQNALQVAQTVAGSLLVRTAVAGGDPNWGRIVAAVGRSGAPVDLSRITVSVNGVCLYENGAPADVPLEEQERAFDAVTITMDINLHGGSACDEFFTCDLTEDYVRINSSYRT